MNRTNQPEVNNVMLAHVLAHVLGRNFHIQWEIHLPQFCHIAMPNQAILCGSGTTVVGEIFVLRNICV